MVRFLAVIFYLTIILFSLLPFIKLVAAAPLVKVAIVDTGLDLRDPRFTPVLCPTGHKDFTGSGIEDTVGHGTAVAGLIKQYAGNADYCLIILKYFKAGSRSNSIQALAEAVSQGVDIVNLSFEGPDFQELEYALIKNNPSITFVAAAGNGGHSLDVRPTYPASYNLPNMIVVGSKDYKNSNYGKAVDAWEQGQGVLSTIPEGEEGYYTGTSMSTAIATGKLIQRLYGKTN